MNTTFVTLLIALDSSDCVGMVSYMVSDLLTDAGWSYGDGDFDIERCLSGHWVSFGIDGTHSKDAVEAAFKSVTSDGILIRDAWIQR